MVEQLQHTFKLFSKRVSEKETCLQMQNLNFLLFVPHLVFFWAPCIGRQANQGGTISGSHTFPPPRLSGAPIGFFKIPCLRKLGHLAKLDPSYHRTSPPLIS